MRYVAILLLLVSTLPAAAQQLAFPEAVGYGRFTVGGRGGTVYEVTTLADAVPAPTGSLRACIEAVGPRTCVFRVTGTIITADATLTIDNPNITIAGQTAPAPGITVRTGCALSGASTLIRASEVIVRFVRFFADERRCGAAVVTPRDGIGFSNQAQTPTGQMNVIIDHVSTRFGADEDISAAIGPCGLTIQWSNMAWGLSKGARLLMPGTPPWTGWENCGVTFAYNLLAHHGDQVPEISRYTQAQVVNNLHYNADTEFGEYRAESGQIIKMTQIGNVAKAGGQTNAGIPLIDLKPLDSLTPGTAGDTGTFQLYMSDNIAGTGTTLLGTGDDVYVVGSPHAGQPAVPAYPASSVEALLTTRAGASLFQDAADRRLIRDLAYSFGAIITAPDEATLDLWTITKMADELWAMPAERKRPQDDSDRDGMPDSWERSNGLDPLDYADNAELTASGYTNLEEYLNSLAAPAFPPPP